MGILNYPRHFFLLGCGSVALVILVRMPVGSERLYFLLGLSGALHAIALVSALRSKSSWLSRLGFVLAAAALTIAVPSAALKLAGLLRFEWWATIFLGLALTSAIGAASYWLLVRGFWARVLSPRSLVVTVGYCVFATFIASFAISVLSMPRDILLPVSWWFAFSASLLSVDRPDMAVNIENAV
jgi:hypothetical protein